MTDRRYQIFISTPAAELEAERKAAIEAVFERGHFPVMLERFSSAIPSDLQLIRRVIRESDAFLLIVGHRYGSVTSPEGLSNAEIEYTLAQEYGLMTIVLMAAESRVREGTTTILDKAAFEDQQRLMRFREKLKKHAFRYFNPGPEFKYLVTVALVDALADRSTRRGYIRESEEQGSLVVSNDEKSQGLPILLRSTEEWNAWRAARPGIVPRLGKADLREAALRRANLRGVDLRGANLAAADLHEADLSSADLSDAVFSHSDLTRANLSSSVANGTQFLKSRLRAATFEGAVLLGANLCGADLEQADLTRVTIGSTVFADNDLSKVVGLESVVHAEPSAITFDTLVRSRDQLPEQFLRGAGLSEELIAYARSFSRTPIEFYSCFISYSSKDHDFAEKLYSDLQQAGIRCWFAPQSLQIGDKFRERIDDSIQLHDKVLLILSQGSVKSSWVEIEIDKALKEEHRRLAPVLIPLRVDDAVMETDRAWAAELRRTRQIGDFRQWRDSGIYRKAVSRLIRDLATDRAVQISRRHAR